MTGRQRTFRDASTSGACGHETAVHIHSSVVWWRHFSFVRQSSWRWAIPDVEQGPPYVDVDPHLDVGRSAVRRRRQLSAGRYLPESGHRPRTVGCVLEVRWIAHKSPGTRKIPAYRVERLPIRRFKACLHRRRGSVGMRNALRRTSSNAVSPTAALTYRVFLNTWLYICLGYSCEVSTGTGCTATARYWVVYRRSLPYKTSYRTFVYM